ncbi:MAG: hypothetical protein IT350_18515 [Deltaproteobacteria bacterium]|nr:hypothetical protein [Deltaproteobacteria bacterium]
MTSAKLGIFALLMSLFVATVLGCAKGEDDEDATVNGNTPGGSSTTTGGGDDDDADDDTDDDTDDGIVTVATVFQSSVWANDVYASLFDEVGWQSYNVLLTDMPETAVDTADLILVDAFTIWQDAATAEFLADTGLPIIGMGSGGLQLFELMGLESSFANTNGIIYDFQDTFTVPDASHPVFTEPVDFSEFLADGDSLDVLNTATDLFGVNLDPVPAGVKVIATREFDESRGGILLEDSKYMSWGLDLSADQLNDTGSALLVNCVAYLTDSGDDFGVE